MAASNSRSRSAGSIGKSAARKKPALDVPPRMRTHGSSRACAAPGWLACVSRLLMNEVWSGRPHPGANSAFADATLFYRSALSSTTIPTAGHYGPSVKPPPTRQKVITGRQAQPLALAINLRHLRALSAVAAAGSASKAAHRMYRVPSAIAHAIAQLERAVGVPLFERRTRGMVTTAHGECVLARARRIERELDEARVQLVASGGVSAKQDVQSTFSSILNGRRLAVLASLTERRNMAVVAREFDITQPAVSLTVKALETDLGVALFERTARGLTPTTAGEIVAFHCRRALSEIRQILPDLAAIDNRLQGSITVGALPLGRTQILPTAIASLLRQHPHLHVATVESPYDVLATSLRSGDVDFILGALRGPARTSDLVEEPLFEDRISIIARAGHPLARRRSVSVGALQRCTWALSRQGAPSRELFERAFAERGQTPPVPAVETGDLAVLRGLLLESDMLTAISAHQLHYELRDGSLVVLGFPLEGTLREIGLSQRADALPSPGARALMDEIRAVVARSANYR
jgi:LysR family transcriptional regulator of gallate degradation